MNRTVGFAESELKKYWELLTGEKECAVRLENEDVSPEDGFEESYSISVVKGKGVIRGCNPRSVLLGVYHFFREAGCRFLYPGREGEYVPSVAGGNVSVCIDFKPKYRHRGITIEGSCSLEQVIGVLDWSVKNGFNSYFIQFRTGYTFFERWYYHNFNPYREKERFDDAKAEEYNEKIRDEMALRGIIYHAVGHGWTCEPLGISSRGWEEGVAVPEKYRKYLAEINGKRDFFKGIPLNTNLCYSNPEARRMMTEEVVSYLKERKDVDVLHVWLGDNWNNYCECENCRKKTPSDWYVILLNEIDAELTKLGIGTKIVFLCYFELLFPPKTERLIHPDRFILMFAPVTRTYMTSYAGETEKAKKIPIGELTVNRFQPPVSVTENIAYLYAWEKIFRGDSFVFDYPLMWDGCRDYGGIVLAKTICDDVGALRKLGLNGYVSCQLQRNFFPTGFCMYVLGRSLYEDGLTYEDLKEDYFRHAFREYAEKVYEILREVSSCKIYAYMRNDVRFDDRATHEEMPRVIRRLHGFRRRVGTMMERTEDKFVLRNLKLVSVMLKLCGKIARIIYEKSSETPDEKKLLRLKRQLQLWIFTAENGVETQMDGSYLFALADEVIGRK